MYCVGKFQLACLCIVCSAFCATLCSQILFQYMSFQCPHCKLMYVGEIWYFDSSVTEDLCLVGCDQMSLAVWLLAPQKNIVPSFSRVKQPKKTLGYKTLGALNPVTWHHIPEYLNPNIYFIRP
jgi:hypothetical protein